MSNSAEKRVDSEPYGNLGTISYRAGRSLCRVLTSLMFDFRVRGTHHIPRRGGVLIVGNHQSYLDPPLYAVQSPRPLSFMAKSELFTGVPWFGRMISNLNAFPVKQGQFDRGALREAATRLRNGRVVLIFPEGGRSEDGQIQPIQRGASLILRQAGPGIRVVPAAVYGAYEAWNRKQKFPKLRPVYLQYGAALDLSQVPDDEAIATIDREIRRNFEELKRDFGNNETA